MPRLGELLVTSRLLTNEQVEQALAAQVVWGGRLGTNLVELKLLDLDGVTRALGRQHGLPAALARHFERADPELQQTLPVGLAQQHKVVPLVRLASGAIAIVAMDPIALEAHGEIAAALGVPPAELVVSIAAELRVRYYLERCYGIARAARFLRSKGTSATPFPKLDEVEVPIDTDPDTRLPEPEAEAPLAKHGSGPHPQADADDLAIMIDRAVESVLTEAPADDSPPGGVDRRRYVPTLGTAQQVDINKTTPLGKIAIRRVERAKSPSLADIAEGAHAALDTLQDAKRALKRATHRDRVAELVIQSIDRFVPTCTAAMVLVVRGGVAVGWKWFTRSGTTPPELAVPMDQPGLVPDVARKSEMARRAADDLGAIDMLLLRALGAMEGDLCVVPIVIGQKVMCMIASVTAEGASLDKVEAIAHAAGAAFARLIRQSSR